MRGLRLGLGMSPPIAGASAPVAVPVNTVAPVASGTATVGSLLSVTTGTWSNSPTGYTYQWKRNGTNIGGATASTYTTVAADAGTTVTAVVTASNVSGAGSPATSNGIAIIGLIQPANFHVYPMGDSRTQYDLKHGGVFGVSSVYNQYSNDTGGVMSWLGMHTGHKLRYPAIFTNAGVTGQTVEQIFASPRASSGTPLSTVAANEAGIVLLMAGTNNLGGAAASLLPGGTARVAYQNAIDALTNPAANWNATGAPLPLAGGLPKNIIIVNELPRGVAADNSLNGATTAPDGVIFEAFATWLQKFDYASGDPLANPRVFVIDAFHNPALLNLADGRGTFLNQPGINADGLHPNPAGLYYVAATDATRLASQLTGSPGFAELPTTASVISGADNLTPNPMLNAGTAGTNSLGGATLLLTAAQPASVSFVGTNMTGLQIEVVAINALGGALGNEMVLRITGTSGTNAQFTIRQASSSTVMNGIDFSSTSTGHLRSTMNIKYTINGANTVVGIFPRLYITSAGGGVNAIDSIGPLPGYRPGFLGTAAWRVNFKNDYIDLSTTTYRTMTSPTVKLAESGLGAGIHPTQLWVELVTNFGNTQTIDFLLTVSRYGAKVSLD